MKVHLFGASVTAQGVTHKTSETVGYAEHLKVKLSSVYDNLEVEVTAAGSSHFNDAGYCLLPEVISSRPDILVLDWHTTGLATFDDKLWRAAIELIRDAEIKTIITIFPRRSDFEAQKERANVSQARDIIGGNIFLLNLSSHEEFNPAIHLRDDVHTTAAGGAFYADLLASKIDNILSQDEEASSSEKIIILPDKNEGIPSVGKYNFGDDFISCKNVSFIVSPDSSFRKPTIVLHAKIGPFSPIVRLRKGGEDISTISIWDPWCYWTRTNYKSIPLGAAFSTPEEFQLIVTNETPAYGECRDKTFDFTPYKDKDLLLISMYCIGGALSSVRHDNSCY
jgi:hypothetical protein